MSPKDPNPSKQEPAQHPTITQLLKGNADVFILAVLKDGPAHGYAIAQEISRRANAVLDFKHGTLYPLLHDLEREGLLVSRPDPEPGPGRPRRVYTITLEGDRHLEQKLKLWQLFNRAMSDVTGAEPSG